MSEAIKHECGIALIRLRKPLSYYAEKYGTCLYGVDKLYLLMEKQLNRGQDGAGVVSVKLGMAPGSRYLDRKRSAQNQPIQEVFGEINARISQAVAGKPERLSDPAWMKENAPFLGEILLGHLRYHTYGGYSLASTHPFLRRSNWETRTLALAGNFNLTNVDEIFQQLVDLGQHPTNRSDSVTMLEKIGHFVDEENRIVHRKYAASGLAPREICAKIAEEMDLGRALRESTKKWDGGYVIAGVVGHGDAFVARDPAGIRPAWVYENDEVVVVASERPQIQAAFGAPLEEIREIEPGNALIVKRDGRAWQERVREPAPRRSCSFERIYFSRGSDRDIYRERKALGRLLVPKVLDAVDRDLEHTVFSFIPNTAESCYYGMRQGLSDYAANLCLEKVRAGVDVNSEEFERLLRFRPRTEKVVIKDTKMRTFIAQDAARNDLVSHVYDVTYGTIEPGVDNLVAIDDSIVRGTTLRESIIRVLDRLRPKRIVIVSSAPQVRYPDCYGIDMAKMGEFVAFQAALSLLNERHLNYVVDKAYSAAKLMLTKPKEEIVNVVKEIYAPFTDDEISAKVAQLLKPVDCGAELKIVYQTLEGLHKAVPDHAGDWYFSGDYPTPGGNRVVCQSFVDYMERRA